MWFYCLYLLWLSLYDQFFQGTKSDPPVKILLWKHPSFLIVHLLPEVCVLTVSLVISVTSFLSLVTILLHRYTTEFRPSKVGKKYPVFKIVLIYSPRLHVHWKCIFLILFFWYWYFRDWCYCWGCHPTPLIFVEGMLAYKRKSLSYILLSEP